MSVQCKRDSNQFPTSLHCEDDERGTEDPGGIVPNPAIRFDIPVRTLGRIVHFDALSSTGLILLHQAKKQGSKQMNILMGGRSVGSNPCH